MGVVNGLSKDRMLAIEAASVVGGVVNGSGHLILTKHDASTIDAGSVVGAPGADAFAPTGFVGEWFTATPPAGWLICDGTEKAIATYPALYAILGTVGGALTNGSGGAGSTHFRLPNYKGKTAVGFDSSQTEFDVVGETGGANTHTHTTPSHTHSTPAHTHTTPSHTHSTPAHSHTTPSHTHSTPAHSHPLSDAGGAKISLDSTNAWIKEALVGGFASWAASVRTNVNAAISIISSTVTGTTAAGLTGDTDNSAAGTSGGASPTTNDSTVGTSGGASPTTDASAAGTSGGATPTTNSSSTLAPYIVVYKIIKT